MTRARWARTFAFGSLLELGAFTGALLHTHALNAVVWAVVFFAASAVLSTTEGSR